MAKQPWKYKFQGLGKYAGQEPWQVSSAIFNEWFTPADGEPVGEAITCASHKAFVQKALVDGKPVLPDILAEYPELQTN